MAQKGVCFQVHKPTLQFYVIITNHICFARRVCGDFFVKTSSSTFTLKLVLYFLNDIAAHTQIIH